MTRMAKITQAQLLLILVHPTKTTTHQMEMAEALEALETLETLETQNRINGTKRQMI